MGGKGMTSRALLAGVVALCRSPEPTFMSHDYGLAPATSCAFFVYFVLTPYMCLIFTIFFSLRQQSVSLTILWHAFLLL